MEGSPDFAARTERATDEPRTASSHRRRRRSTSTERNVELLVVIDKHMVQYYMDQDIETYVLTIMNIVSTALLRSVMHESPAYVPRYNILSEFT